MILKNRIKAYRTFAGLTQSDLGERIGLSTNSICSIEQGQTNPSAYYAALFCRFFRVPFEQLFYLDNDEVRSDEVDEPDDTEDYLRHLYCR